MEIKFSFDKEAQFPYKAEYFGKVTVPICARIGMGVAGRNNRTHSNNLKSILGDLRGCEEKINVVYTEEYIDTIGTETMRMTDLTVGLLNDYNKVNSIISRNFEYILKLRNKNNEGDIGYKEINFLKK
jgi:hypothetical protein